MNDIIYNGKSLRELGFAIKHHPVHYVAERDVEFVSITGRSGDAIIDNARYKNVEMSYDINTVDFRYLQNTNVTQRKLIDWLMSGDGTYKRFEDSTNPGYFCKALCTGIGDIRRNNLNGYLDTTISFNREPYWYSNLGQKSFEITPSKTAQEFNNPENYISRPYIKIYFAEGASVAFKLIINGDEYVFSAIGEYVEIDSEAYNVHRGTTNVNNSAQCDYMPIFIPGVNTFAIEASQGSLQSKITRIEITPNWRRL